MEIQGRGPDRAAIEAILDRLRPGLIADGGNIELLDVESDGVVRVIFQGACRTCPAQAATLRVAIEEPLRKEVPGISAVVPA